MECDAEHDWARAVQPDYRARLCASTAGKGDREKKGETPPGY
jgi:hypothetical protein